jgi:2-succinyl-6-hydroxy-2,4-cyclohexadiene-1-carboxylate synthase
MSQVDHVATPNGPLAVRRRRAPGEPLVCLHGFTRNGAMFGALGDTLDWELAAPDLPGHGESQVAPVDLEATMGALAAWLNAEMSRPVDILGYSMGGRIALHLAVRHPGAVANLVVISAGPGLGAVEGHRRRLEDLALADRIEQIGLPAFLDEWAEHPLVGDAQKTGPPSAADRAMREQNTAGGLAAALRGLGQGALAKVDLARVEMPTLWVAGEGDERYAAIATDAARLTGGELVVIPGAGHDVVADAPEDLADAVADFIG